MMMMMMMMIIIIITIMYHVAHKYVFGNQTKLKCVPMTAFFNL